MRLPTPDPDLSLMENARNIFRTITTEPLFEGFITGLLSEPNKPARPQEEWAIDESLAEFITRRFNRKIADNLVSAVMHGIYADNIDEMSAQAIMGPLRNLEDGGILFGLLIKSIMGKKTRSMDDFLAVDAVYKTPETMQRLDEINRVVKTASTFTFKRGTQQLVEGLTRALRASEKVRLVMDADILALDPPANRGHKLKVIRSLAISFSLQDPFRRGINASLYRRLTCSRSTLELEEKSRSTMSFPPSPRRPWRAFWIHKAKSK